MHNSICIIFRALVVALDLFSALILAGMDGPLSNKPSNYMVDPEKLFRKTRHSAKFSQNQNQDETLPKMGAEPEKKLMDLCVPTSLNLRRPLRSGVQ